MDATTQQESTGSFARPIAPPRLVRVARASHWQRALPPVVLVALVLAAAAGVYYVRFGFARADWQGRHQPIPAWLAFNDIGRRFAGAAGDLPDAVAPIGYDGQFFFFMAQDPGVIVDCAHGRHHCPIDASPLREERILYPMTARALALGQPQAIHAALFLLDVAAILITVFIVGQLCLEAGASRWLALAVGSFCGEILGLVRDLADPFAAMWLALALYLLRKDRPYWCAAAAAAAMLSREQLVLILPLLGLPWLAQRRWRTLLVAGLIAFTPFVAWQLVLHQIYGTWGLRASFTTTHGIGVPFHGLWEYRNGPEFWLTVACVALPLVLTLLVALAWLARNGPRALLRDPVPLVAVVYCVLLTLTAEAEWEGMWNSARLLVPAAILGILIVSEQAPGLRRSYAVVLGLTALAPLFMLPALF
jgi:hypothetical protein